MVTKDLDLKIIRMLLWKDVAVAVASSDNAVKPTVMASWADAALEAFDRRFENETIS